MQNVYVLVSGPLAWAAWTIFVLGSIFKIWKTLAVAKQKDQVLLNYISFKYGMRSIINWSIPFNTTNMRLHPIFTGVAFLFHIGFFVLLLFLSFLVALLKYLVVEPCGLALLKGQTYYLI